MRIKDLLITGISYIRQPSKRKLIASSYGLKSKKGLEIGGPSSQFSLLGYFPVYLFAEQIDGVNFSTNTVWEGTIEAGKTYKYHNKTGYQYVLEASSLEGIESESYDFVLSCHSLEHVANPLQALTEWKRVLKPGGLLILFLPDKENTFDINRPYTTMSHLLQDYQNKTGEEDTTHFEEIIQFHELSRDTGTASREDLKALLKENHSNRRAHHHVFSLPVVAEALQHLSFTVLHQQKAHPFHLITVAKKN